MATAIADLFGRFRPLRVIPPDELERGLRLVLYDGVAAQMTATLTGGAFLVAYAPQLGASPFLIGVIGALQPLTQFLQLPTIYLGERVGPRKLMVVTALTISRSFCFVLLVLPWWAPEPQRLQVLIASLLMFYGVAWNPWVRDLIPRSA